MFLLYRQGVLGSAGQTHRHSGAEVEGPVVPATVDHGLNREVRPLRELVGDEPTDLFRIDGNTLGHGTELRWVAHRDILIRQGKLKLLDLTWRRSARKPHRRPARGSWK